MARVEVFFQKYMEEDVAVEAIVVLLMAVVLDWILGDPMWLNVAHPIIYFGKAISFLDKRFNSNNQVLKDNEVLRGDKTKNDSKKDHKQTNHHDATTTTNSTKNVWQFVKGTFTSTSLVIGTYVGFSWLSKTCHKIHFLFGIGVDIYFTFMGLAGTTLIKEGNRVFDATSRSLEEGRQRLSWIVSRNTSNLSKHQIYIATLECLSENLSDGVIGPLLAYAFGSSFLLQKGMPCIMTYKMINTLDSIIGYRSEKYEYYGKFAARLDDVVNLIPSRWTALCMCIVNMIRCIVIDIMQLCTTTNDNQRRLNTMIRPWFFVWKYRHCHKSPNAAYPEAALAGILDVQFGGPNMYHGTVVDKPFIGTNPRPIVSPDLTITIWINRLTEITTIVIIVVLIIFLR